MLDLVQLHPPHPPHPLRVAMAAAMAAAVVADPDPPVATTYVLTAAGEALRPTAAQWTADEAALREQLAGSSEPAGEAVDDAGAASPLERLLRHSPDERDRTDRCDGARERNLRRQLELARERLVAEGSGGDIGRLRGERPQKGGHRKHARRYRCDPGEVIRKRERHNGAQPE